MKNIATICLFYFIIGGLEPQAPYRVHINKNWSSIVHIADASGRIQIGRLPQLKKPGLHSISWYKWEYNQQPGKPLYSDIRKEKKKQEKE